MTETLYKAKTRRTTVKFSVMYDTNNLYTHSEKSVNKKFAYSYLFVTCSTT